MASAAAVGAATRVPALPDNLDSDADITGHVGPMSDADDDSDDVRPRRTVEDEGQTLDDDDEQMDDDDLFGDGDEQEQSPPNRKLDDEDLDSGDDEGRTDRVAPVAEEVEYHEMKTIDADISRHPIPEPSDNEVYLVKVPKFLSIEPTAWHHKTFQPPTTDHHSKGPPSELFSAYGTALSTIRWRRSPSNPSELQSNARILRWSDGSLTLQFASDALVQYDIDGNALAPPQVNPKKPTPKSIRTKPGRPVPQYNAAQDAFTYLAAPCATSSIMRITNKVTTSLAINAVGDSNDEALEQLQNALAAAAKSRNPNLNESGGVAILPMDVDPEAEILKAQAAAKEKAKQARAREKQHERERDRTSRALGSRGMRTAGGLSAGDLEGAGRTGGAKKPRAKTGLRRDWSDDEDYGGRKHTREDEYDEEDDFIAASDEEDMGEASEEEEEEELEEPEERSRRKATQSPKRNRPAADDDEDDVVPNVARTKRRRVIDDDDDDDE